MTSDRDEAMTKWSVEVTDAFDEKVDKVRRAARRETGLAVRRRGLILATLQELLADEELQQRVFQRLRNGHEPDPG